MNKYFDKIYLINGDDYRLSQCKEEFKKHNLTNIKIIRRIFDNHNIDLISLWIDIVKEAKEKGYKKILIHEDDFVYINYDLFEDVSKQLDNYNWSIFYLGGLFIRKPYKIRTKLNNKTEGYEKISKNLININDGNLLLAHSVAISDKAHDEILNFKEYYYEIKNNKNICIDHLLIKRFQRQSKYITLAACPLITTSTPNISYRSNNKTDFKELDSIIYKELLK